MPPKDKKPDPKAAAAAPTEPQEEVVQHGTWDGDRNGQDLPDGKGKATYPNGDVYEGTFRNDKREEHGVYTWKPLEDGKSGGRYEGGYDSNLKSGKGTMAYPDGGVYDGQWHEGFRHGQGTFKYPNGDWYKGMWNNGQKSGLGTYYSYSGSCWYVGTWLNGEFQSGEWKFKDGSCYKGSFKGGRPAPGEGTFLFPNGNRQMGKWVQTTSEELDAEGKPKTNVFWVGGDLVVGQTG